MTLLTNTPITSTDTHEIRQHIYEEAPNADVQAIADDITENGYLDPTGDPTSDRLTNVQVHFFIMLGKLLIFVTFGIPIP